MIENQVIENQVIESLRTFVDRFLGRGDATITVPPFDGALKPNQLLEKAETVASFAAAEDIATDGQAIYIADGAALLRFAAGSTSTIRSFDRTITALCCLPDGRIAIALDGREVRVFATPSSPRPDATFADPSMSAVNALAPGPDGTLIATDGSAMRTCGQWAYDLMERGHSGRLLSLDIASGSVRMLASGLHYAFGVCAFEGALLVSESWQHRLIAVATDAWQPAQSGAGQSAGLSLTSFSRPIRRLLADGVHCAHPTGRVRAARKRLPAPHDEGNRPAILGCTQAEIGPVIP